MTVMLFSEHSFLFTDETPLTLRSNVVLCLKAVVLILVQTIDLVSSLFPNHGSLPSYFCDPSKNVLELKELFSKFCGIIDQNLI